MSRTTVATALQRIAMLTPVTATGPSRLTGDGVYVCTPVVTVPDDFRAAQELRTAIYMKTGRRDARGFHVRQVAPRYIVTSYGVPIAWVTLDGRTHYAHVADGSEHSGARLRHQAAIRAAWPERFRLDEMGDPVPAEDDERCPRAGRSASACDSSDHRNCPDLATV